VPRVARRRPRHDGSDADDLTPEPSCAHNKPAYRMAGSGSAITYGELDRVSNQGAQQLRALGLKPQDHIALLAENSLHFFEICWVA
jgi:acyl-CoA synthetase (AMP-forming)/AMP-acid ligase II